MRWIYAIGNEKGGGEGREWASNNTLWAILNKTLSRALFSNKELSDNLDSPKPVAAATTAARIEIVILLRGASNTPADNSQTKRGGRRPASAQQHFLPERPLECASWDPLVAHTGRPVCIRLSTWWHIHAYTHTRQHVYMHTLYTSCMYVYKYTFTPLRIFTYVYIRIYTLDIRSMTFGTGHGDKGVYEDKRKKKRESRIQRYICI